MLLSVSSSIISFLPSPNLFGVCFDGKHPTRYIISTVINYFADVSDHLSTYKFNVCDNGSCILKKDINSRCVHTIGNKKSFYYMSMRECMEHLLNSDLKNMFLYPYYKYRSPKVFTSICHHFVIILSSIITYRFLFIMMIGKLC